VRFCSVCQREVHFCCTPEEFVAHGKRGHCIAIPENAVLGRLLVNYIGEPSPEAVKELEAHNQRILRMWLTVLGEENALDREQAQDLRSRGFYQAALQERAGAGGKD
jgi:hypothetical protein